MKIKVLLFTLVLSFNLNFAQSNTEIAYVYLKRAEDSFEKNEIENSVSEFKKSLKFNDTLNDSRVGRLGMLLHYELGNFHIAKVYTKEYFDFVVDKTSEEYQNMLDLYVSIQEGIDQFNKELKIKTEKIEKEKREKRRLDSLNTVWETLSQEFILNVDSVYALNKNNIAVYRKGKAIGIIDDFGNIVKKPSVYHDYLSYDGIILMLDQIDSPTKIYAYKSEEKSGFLLPSLSTFNNSSKHYGKVMLPRGNGLIVTYPDNSNKAFIYNLKTKNFEIILDVRALLKTMNKNDIIEKYSKEEQLRINKKWFYLGGHLGSNIYPLYSENKLFGFLNASNGKILDNQYYNYLGGFYDGTYELLETNKRLWMDNEGVRQDSNKNENGRYEGKSRFMKLENDNYVILQNKEGKDYLVLGDKTLLNKKQFVAEAPR